MRRPGTQDIAPMLLLGVFVFFVAGALLPAFQSPRKRTMMPEATAIRSICQAVTTYFMEHDSFPPVASWQESLIEPGYIMAEDLKSPRNEPGSPDYFYYELPPERDFDSSALLLYENPEHYRRGTYKDGTFAVFADCHVEWLTLEELDIYCQAQQSLPHDGP